MTTYEIQKELNSLYAEREELNTMSEQDICAKHNVDFAQEAIDVIEEEIRYYENLQAENEETEVDDYWQSYGFRDEADYSQYRYGRCWAI